MDYEDYFGDLLENPDGDYRTGRTIWVKLIKGQSILDPHPEIVVIKNHKIVGFRSHDGAFIPLSSQSNDEMNIPPLKGVNHES